MKKLLLFALLLIGFSAIKAQTPISYSEVVQVEGATKDELYQRAKNWFVDMFRSANDVIQLDDKEAGQIIGKGNFSYPQKVNWAGVIANNTIKFKASIAIKDGRYRYEFSDFEHSMSVPGSPLNLGFITDIAPQSKAYPKKMVERVYAMAVQEISDNAASFAFSLEKAMTAPTQTQSDDW